MQKCLVSIVAVLVVAAACSSGSDGASPAERNPALELDGDDVRLLSRLVPFADCAELLDHIKSEATERVGPYGLDFNGYPIATLEGDAVGGVEESAAEPAEAPAAEFDDAAATDDGASGEVAQSGGEGGDGGDFTGTNVQELGIDEPDLVKTDGDRIIVVAQNQLSYVDLAGGDAVITDQLRIDEGWSHELFFRGDRALLFSRGDWGHGPIPVEPLIEGDAEAQFAEGADVVEPEWFGPASTVYEIDLSDTDDLEITSTLRIQGEYLSARLVGGTVRLALTSPPVQLPWVYPSNPAGEERAERFNRELVAETTIEDWIPQYELTTPDGTSSGPLLECDRLHRPAEFSGFDVVSVLSFGLADGLDTGDGAGVLASGRTVYASADRFYVATTKWAGEEVTTDQGWREWTEDYDTDVHGFAIDSDEPARYVASGTVPGSLLNQFSMDEYEGYLRIVTTEGSPWDDRNRSETMLTVLDERDDVLEQVGQVGGLGKGETLFSARLFDDYGFAVTFRQIDPFYVLDLRDPTNPRVTGELKIPGFSTYLHPVSDTLVLGIGQDATEDGRQVGLKASLFDVSDPADPREVAVWTMPDAWSPAESDHRAFQWLPDERIAIIPAQAWNQEFNGAVLLEIGDETISEIGRVTHVEVEDEPTTDCERLEGDEFPEETELYWMALDGAAVVQFCDDVDEGGYGGFGCEVIPLDDLRFWGPEDVMSELIDEWTDGDPGPEDRIEICWPNGDWQRQIQRSMVIGDDLWTMSWAQLQANDLTGDLEPTQILPL